MISADGVPVSYQVGGEGSVSVVFVHGWLCDRTYWRYQLEHFSGSYRVAALDLAGHGQSGVERDDWSMAAFGQDVAAVLELLDLRKVVLVGHSMGALVILEAARLDPGRIVGLVAVDGLHDLDAPPPTPDAVERAVAAYDGRFDQRIREVVAAAMFLPETDSLLKEWIVEDMAAGPPGVGVGALEHTLRWQADGRREALESLDAPLRLINSALFATDSAAARRRGIDVVIIPGVGHFLMLEDPATFNSLLGESLAAFTGCDSECPNGETR